MMFAERWLSKATPATSATAATRQEKTNNPAAFEVATTLLTGCYLTSLKAPGSGNVALGSKGAATRLPAENSRSSNQVAGVAEVAGRRSRHLQHNDRTANKNDVIHQSKVAASTALHHSFADLRDQVEEGSALAEHEGGLSRSDAERQAFAGAARLLPHLDPKIIEQAGAWFNAHCPAEWALGVLWLQTMSAPLAFPEQRWRQFQADTVAFAGSWSKQAIETGWTAIELFGLSINAPWHNWRGFGVVPMLNGHVITAIDAEMLTIMTKTKATQRHRRRSIWHDAVPAWEIGA